MTRDEKTLVVDGDAFVGEEQAASRQRSLLRPGEFIEESYEVKEVFDGGGMGIVYRVFHHEWNCELAVKVPRVKGAMSRAELEGYEQEANTWVDVPPHPHVTSCFYVRTIRDLPHLFLEYVEGGSLRAALAGGTFPPQGQEPVPHILDVAIQLAWGLQHAHDNGVVHQDVKPGNVLLTGEGIAKITDFGLSRAWNVVPHRADERVGADGRTVWVPGAGMLTEAYASPEQFAGADVSMRSDMWSWALVVLEMFLGERTWLTGTAAPSVLEEFVEGGGGADATSMPAGLLPMVGRCFEAKPGDRPGTMGEIADQFIDIYRREAAEEYPRSRPRAAEFEADHLNNRAVSLVDLGRASEASQLFDRLWRDYQGHLCGQYNAGVHHWRRGEIRDDELLEALEGTATDDEDYRKPYLVSMVHAERGDFARSFAVVDDALQRVDTDSPVQGMLIEHKHRVMQLRPAWDGRTITTDATICQMAFVDGGDWLLTGGEDGFVRVWDVATGQEDAAYQAHAGPISAFAAVDSSDFPVLMTGCDDDPIKVWDWAHDELIQEVAKGLGEEGNLGETILAVAADTLTIATVGAWGRGGTLTARSAQIDLIDIPYGERDEFRDKFSSSHHTVSAIAVDRSVRTLVFAGYGEQHVQTSGVDLLRNVESTDSDAPEGAGRWLYSELEPRHITAGNVAVDSAGTRVAAGCSDGFVRIWDLDQDELRATVADGSGWLDPHVSLSSDGRRMLVWCSSRASLWDLVPVRCTRIFVFDRESRLKAATLADDGSRLALTDGHTITIHAGTAGPAASWAPSVTRLYSHEREQAFAHAIALVEEDLARGHLAEAHERLMAARIRAGRERDSRVWSLHRQLLTGRCKSQVEDSWCSRVLRGHAKFISAVRITPDGRTAVSASEDGTIAWWDVAAGRRLRTVKGVGPVRVGEEGLLSNIAISADGETALSVSSESHRLSRKRRRWCPMRLWTADREDSRTIESHRDWVVSVDLTPDAVIAASGEHSGFVCVENLDSRDKLILGRDEIIDTRFSGWDPPRFEGRMRVDSLTLSRDGGLLLFGTRSGGLSLWDVHGQHLLASYRGHGTEIRWVGLSPRGDLAMSGDSNGVLTAWELGPTLAEPGPVPTRTWSVTGPGSAIVGGAITLDGRFVVTACAQGTVDVWDLADGSLSYTHDESTHLTDLSMTADGTRVVVGTTDGEVRVIHLLWDSETRSSSPSTHDAEPLLSAFLEAHRPLEGLARVGVPAWTDDDAVSLMRDLEWAGLAGLDREEVDAWLDQHTHVGGEP